MRKSLMMVCSAVFLTAMCLVPSIHGDDPCPYEISNGSSKYLCAVPDNKGYNKLYVDSKGYPIDVLYEKYCALPPASGKAACEGQKVISYINPDVSVAVSAPNSVTYVAIYFPDPLFNEPGLTNCFSYMTCKYIQSTNECKDDKINTGWQLDYADYPCQ